MAGLLTLGALATAYIDWCGARAWKACLAKETAAGRDPLRLPVPSTLPESENFLLQPKLAPLWFKIADGSKPALDPLQGIPTGLPAGYNWWRGDAGGLEALRAYLNSNHVKLPKDADHKTLLNALLDTQSAFVPLREDMTREYARRPLSELRRPKPIPKESPFDSPFIEFKPARTIYQCLEKEGLTALANGQGSLACTDMLLELRLSRGILDTPDNVLVEAMVGVVTLGSSLNSINVGTRLHAWNDEQLALLMKELSQQRPVEALQRCFQHELAFGVLTMEGYSSGQCLGLSFKLNPESGWNRVLWIPRGFVEESKAMLVDISNLNRERLSRVYSPELQNQFLEQLTPEAKFKDYSVFNPCLNIVMELYPATEKVLFSTIKKTAERDMALTACALERYRLRHQDYPATLGELVPDFLPSVPRDIADGEALRYTRDSNDDYTLYSVGLIESERGPIKDSKKPAASHSNTVQQWSWPKVTGK